MADSDRDFGPFVVTLCAKFLAEAHGDIDLATRMMFQDLAGTSSRDHELEQNIRRAMADYSKRTKRPRVS